MWLIGKTLSWLDQRQGRFGFTGDRNARLSARRPSPRRIAQRRPTAARTPGSQCCAFRGVRGYVARKRRQPGVTNFDTAAQTQPLLPNPVPSPQFVTVTN